ncbi:hypothetical protein M422DRAFT_266722 [Sphaerobolus stellatus SS14]|uniref:Uncharacterized protein n=1 Tax=Sphaerobolus stellatus (strain SS14) TaxID=990650 RepID=A0A0C9UR14_SPHS4|nr:hypothetical protein M422DRAFT_266722 [Sphaerobolus stellatus SS14]
MPPPGLLRPGAPGGPPLPPGMPMPPFPPGGGPPFHGAPPPGLPPGGPTPPFPPTPVGVLTPPAAPTTPVRSLPTPNPSQTNPPLKAGTVLVWQDANYSPIEKRALEDKYRFNIAQASQPPPVHVSTGDDSPSKDGPRGTKRARAEDFM